MAWVTPKTDWKYTDYFDVAKDYGRIRGNLLEIVHLINILYGYPAITTMQDFTYKDVGLGFNFYNVIEGNIKAIDTFLKAYGLDCRIQATKTWTDNKPAWDYRDLKRIEETQVVFRVELLKRWYGRQRLAFTLKEGGIYYA